MSGSYNINVNQAKKSFDMVITGNFTPELTQKFVNEYQTKVSSIQPGDFILKLDCTDLKLVTPEMIPDLEACYKMYESSGFHKVVFEIKNSAILKMQLNRIAKSSGLKNVEMVEV